MKKAICILSASVILLCLCLVVLWLPAFNDGGKPQGETRFGVSEGLELVEQAYAGKEKEIRALVGSVVTTYHPIGKQGLEYKDETFEKQRKFDVSDNSEREKFFATI